MSKRLDKFIDESTDGPWYWAPAGSSKGYWRDPATGWYGAPVSSTAWAFINGVFTQVAVSSYATVIGNGLVYQVPFLGGKE